MIPHAADVFVVRASSYTGSASVIAPELPSDALRTPALIAVRELLRLSGLDAERFDSASWNPFGEIVPAGKRVLLKPNWVLHRNMSGAGTDCLLTHPSIIEAVLEYALLARPASLVIGDAPVQGCDFDALREIQGLDAIQTRAKKRGIPVDFVDFRLLIRDRGLRGHTRGTARTPGEYVRFDLAGNSFLEDISSGNPRFRVTMYDPHALEATHGKGRHQYLIAREVIDADLVINLPKLKTHKKACVTGALKNLVGINGHKSYLPHHRKGGSAGGGDCYPGNGPLKAVTEHILDIGNAASPGPVRTLCNLAARVAVHAARSAGSYFDIEGSWYGNDTVWRTALDLQAILRYGDLHGHVLTSPQRVVLSITDAIVGGQGEGPLAPTPANLGFMTLAMNPASAEWVHAYLMGLNPALIPIIREAFSPTRLAVADCIPRDIRVRLGSDSLSPADAAAKIGSEVCASEGWKGHCEWRPGYAPAA